MWACQRVLLVLLFISQLLLLVSPCVLWLYMIVLVVLSSVRPLVLYSVRPSVCLSVCMFTCTYVETNVLVYVLWTSKIELTWLIPCLVWVFTGHSFHLVGFFLGFFRVVVQTTALPVCAPFYAKTAFTIAKKYTYILWAITLYYSTSRFKTVTKVKSQTPYNFL